MIIFDKQRKIGTTTGINFKALNLYKFTFSVTLPLKTQFKKIKIGEKEAFVYLKKENDKTVLYLYPLTDMSPIVLIIGALIGLGIMGLSIALLDKIESVSGVLYGGMILTIIVLYLFKVKKK